MKYFRHAAGVVTWASTTALALTITFSSILKYSHLGGNILKTTILIKKLNKVNDYITKFIDRNSSLVVMKL